jgi:hypothetical protein
MSFVGEIAQTQNMSNKNKYPSHVSDEEWTLTYKNRSLPAPPNVFGMSRAYASHYAGACGQRHRHQVSAHSAASFLAVLTFLVVIRA